MPNRRPQLRLVTSASPAEAAAVVAALERFLRDFARPQEEARQHSDRWTRAARLEAVRADARWDALAPWGDPHPWGR